MRRHSIRFFLALIAITMPATGGAQNRAERQTISEVRMLQEQTMRLQLLIAGLEDTLQALSGQLDEQATTTLRAFADQRLQSEGTESDLRILREKLDDTNVRISSMSQEIEALRIAIPRVPYPTTELLTDPETGLPTSTAIGTIPPPAPLMVGASPKRMYDTAWADYASGQWDLAVEGFEAYLAMFPRSELADDAQFYVGETHYADGRFQEAINAFESVLLNHPDGDVAPETHYKRGLAHDRLGETDRARQAFEFLIVNYPDSPMATLAQQALDRLSQLER